MKGKDVARTDTIGLLSRYYEAFNRSDSAAMLACLSDNVAHDINQAERQTGIDAFRAFLAHMDRCYSERLTDIVVMANNAGTRGAAEFIVHGKYLAADEGLPQANGQSYILPAGAFFELEAGAITRVSVYYNLADWTAQVGG